MPAMHQLGSSTGIDMMRYHDSQLRALSTKNKKDYHLKLEIAEEGNIYLYMYNSAKVFKAPTLHGSLPAMDTNIFHLLQH